MKLLKLSLVVLSLCLLVSGSTKRTPRFEDLYECYIIVDAEASGYDDDEFEQIDYEDFLSIIHRSRLVYIGFEPAWQVNLFDDYDIRYSIYVSRSCRFIRIGTNYFKLSRRCARRLKVLLGGA